MGGDASKLSLKINHSSEYKHVKSSYMNTDKVVNKLRSQAEERRIELETKKKNNQERMGWATPFGN